MNTKTTVILALICAVVFAYVLLVVKPWEPGVEPEKPTADGTPLLDPKPEGIDRIELARRDGPAFVFTHADEDEWDLEAPIQAPASRFEVDALRIKVRQLLERWNAGPRPPDGRRRRVRRRLPDDPASGRRFRVRHP